MLARRERAQADLDWHFAAALALSEEFAPAPHCASARILHERTTIVCVAIFVALRNEHIDALAEQFGGSVPKHLLDLPVGEHDRAPLVHDQDGAGDRFEDRANALLIG